MPYGDLEMSTQVFARSRFGEFISELEAAGTRTVEKSLEDGARVARGIVAPHSKTGATLGSIRVKMVNAREGRIVAGGATVFLEGGTRPHPIPLAGGVANTRDGRLHFFWEREGRWFHGPRVNHPGSKGLNFLALGGAAANAVVIQNARREYP